MDNVQNANRWSIRQEFQVVRLSINRLDHTNKMPLTWLQRVGSVDKSFLWQVVTSSLTCSKVYAWNSLRDNTRRMTFKRIEFDGTRADCSGFPHCVAVTVEYVWWVLCVLFRGRHGSYNSCQADRLFSRPSTDCVSVLCHPIDPASW
jgi:hypothetical protein